MLLEFLSECITDTSLFYFYLSLFLSAIGALSLVHIHFHHYVNAHTVYTKKSNMFTLHAMPTVESVGDVTAIRNWLVRKIKRMEGPDDDADSDSFFLFNPLDEKQGGQSWKQNLYSHPLKNMDSLALFLF